MLEKLLYELPECIELNGDMLWLHLQPTLNHKTWNAFYGAVTEDGGVSVYHTEAETPLKVLQDLQALLNVRTLLAP